METSLPTPMTARVKLLIYQRGSVQSTGGALVNPRIFHVDPINLRPSGYVKIAIEHGHRNSRFTHWKWWFFIVMWQFTKGYSLWFYGWLVVWNMFFLLFHFFPSYWECHHPESQLTKSIMFQRGRSTTNQMGIQVSIIFGQANTMYIPMIPLEALSKLIIACWSWQTGVDGETHMRRGQNPCRYIYIYVDIIDIYVFIFNIVYIINIIIYSMIWLYIIQR